VEQVVVVVLELEVEVQVDIEIHLQVNPLVVVEVVKLFYHLMAEQFIQLQ
jgi:hypothetical protein